MVLERLFPEDWLERKFIYAFILGVSYSVLGIIIARLLFTSNSGIVSVFFTSIFLSPSMRKIFSIEELSEKRAKKFSMKKLYQLDYDVILMYFLIFLGIFASYLAFSFLLPQFGIDSFHLLKEQLFLDQSLRGRATDQFHSILSITYNNWWVLLATFVLGLIAGDGAIFFVAWNASAWGTIFGARVLQASIYSGQNSWYLLFGLLIVVIWHVILEGGAYLLVGISGSTISQEIVKEKIEVKEFLIWIVISFFLFYLINFLIRDYSIYIKFIIYLALTFAMLHYLGKIVAEKKNRQVYTFNLAVFMIALLVFILGVVVEVYVLSNSSILHNIYSMSSCYSSKIPFEICSKALV